MISVNIQNLTSFQLQEAIAPDPCISLAASPLDPHYRALLLTPLSSTFRSLCVVWHVWHVRGNLTEASHSATYHCAVRPKTGVGRWSSSIDFYSLHRRQRRRPGDDRTMDGAARKRPVQRRTSPPDRIALRYMPVSTESCPIRPTTGRRQP